MELESNFRIVKFNVYVLCNIMTNRFREIKQLISDRYGIDKSQKDLRSDRKELEEVSGMETDWDAVNLDVSAKLIEMEERHKLIDRLLQKYDRMNLTAEQMVASGCEEYRWYVSFCVGCICSNIFSSFLFYVAFLEVFAFWKPQSYGPQISVSTAS